MSTDAWIEEHWTGDAVLPRPRRAPKLPALPVPHAPTCSRGNAALAAHAQSRDSARHPGDGLSARQDGRNVVDQPARKLTQPPGGARVAVSIVVNFEEGAEFSVSDGDPENEAIYEIEQRLAGRPEPAIDSHFEYGSRV